MCFNNSLSIPLQAIEQYFEAKSFLPEPFSPVYHASAFSFPDWPVITSEFPGVIQPFSWGLIPSWVKDAEKARDIRSFTLNAKSETLFEKPSFRAAAKYRRCLVPSTGFFEWYHQGRQTYPFFISLKSQPLFAMAGLWESWTEPHTDHTQHTFTIVTTEANTLMAAIHNTKKRMPVILTRDAAKAWLNADLDKPDIARLCKPLDPALLQAHPVAKRLSSRTENTNTPDIQTPVTYPDLSLTLP